MKETIELINTADLIPFRNHPFKPRYGEEQNQLIESIRNSGIVEPLIVRPSSASKYEVISGHRRLAACRELGIKSMPVIVRDLSDEQAVTMMIDSNLHRESILPSEKAFMYRMKMEALSAQGKRTDLTDGQAGHKSRDDVSKEESGRTVQRYIRLTNLIPELLEMVDEGRIAISPGVELSYLTEEQQRILLDAMELNDCTPSHAQSIRLKKLSQEEMLDHDGIYSIISEEKPNQRERLRLPMESMRKFAPKANEQQLEDFVIKACEHYRKYLDRRRDAR